MSGLRVGLLLGVLLLLGTRAGAGDETTAVPAAPPAPPTAAAPLARYNIATLSCAGYHEALLNERADVPHPDSIDFVMWLLGYSIAAAGEHVMYVGALTPFGFALDAECRDRPLSSLREAIVRVQLRRTQSMDLAHLNCHDFESRNADVEKTDPQSAATIMSGLQGYAAARAGTTVLDTGARTGFAAALAAECAARWHESLDEAIAAVAASQDSARRLKPPAAHGR